MPEMDLFIDLHLSYFTCPEFAEKLFSEKVDFVKVYDLVFENK